MMKQSAQTVVVLGATGKQGGAVASALQVDGWVVRALVRDRTSARARALADAGIDVKVGDLNDPASLEAAFTGAHGVFSVQPSSGQAGSDLTDADEFRFATTVVDLAHRCGISHLVYSSTVAASSTPTGIPHLDVKSRIENYVRDAPITATVVRPATFMEILVLPGMGLDQGRLSFLMRPERVLQFIAVPDIGRIVAAVFASPGRYAGTTFDIAGDALSGQELARHLSAAAGRPISYSRLPTTLLESDEVLRRTATLTDDGGLDGNADLQALRAEFPFLLSFDRWLAGPGAALLQDALRAEATGVALQ